MTDSPTLSAELTKSLTSIWTRYAGKPPADGRTEIRGNVVTCVLVDGVADFNRATAAPAESLSDEEQMAAALIDNGRPRATDYKREAVAAVVRVTRQRVSSFISSHDCDTDVATEVFTLEPGLARGRRPRPVRAGR